MECFRHEPVRPGDNGVRLNRLKRFRFAYTATPPLSQREKEITDKMPAPLSIPSPHVGRKG